ncbi:MAG TPA: PH domain-containing protein [Steroidobacteraceae bacterium]|nr:PH domain-containing protein [Steroidobacteraceae bacterium]
MSREPYTRTSQDLTFRSDRDTALTLALLVLPLMLLFAMFGPWPGRAPPAPLRWLSVITLMLGVVMPVWVYFGTDYTLRASELLIRSGPFRWRIPLAAIHEVSESRSLRSSPALSMNRLAIRFGADRTLLISPLNRQEFRRELERRRAGVRQYAP